MLAANRKIGKHIQTPLLIPSFSSKGFPYVDKILEISKEFIKGPLLVSAYDLYHKFISDGYPENAKVVFLDSGGYEASKDKELSDINPIDYYPKTWSRDEHKHALENWDFSKPTIVINYDNPNEKYSIREQIDKAKEQLNNYPHAFKEILLKTGPGEYYLNISEILGQLEKLSAFDIIGVTEKELGHTMRERIINLKLLREALIDKQLDKPIHIFGCLDPIATPLFFLAGADIFDGLTWLRFAYMNDLAIYKYQYLTINMNLEIPDEHIDIHVFFNNYKYMMELQKRMNDFVKSEDYTLFGTYNEKFREIYDSLIMEEKGV